MCTEMSSAILPQSAAMSHLHRFPVSSLKMDDMADEQVMDTNDIHLVNTITKSSQPMKKVCFSNIIDLCDLTDDNQTLIADNPPNFNQDKRNTELPFAVTTDVITGENPDAIKLVKYGLISKKECTYHSIMNFTGKENRNINEIKIKISQPICVNHILLRLFDSELFSYSYYVEVSEDDRNWNRIADYRQYQCRSWQRLYFKSIKIQFVRIVGTKIHNETYWPFFAVSSIQFFNLCSLPNTLNHILCPNEDMALQSKGALLLCGANDCILDNTIENKNSNFTYHKLDSCIIVQIPQVIIAENLSLKTYGITKYEFKVWLSIDNKKWKLVYDYKSSCCYRYKSDHLVEFESQPILFIKIKGKNVDKYHGNDDSFRLVSLKCPNY